MDRFQYIDGTLHAEGLEAEAIAQAVGTPCYVYSRGTLREHYQRLADAFAPLSPLICFSIKSCSNLSVVRELHALGAGMDLVSGGELHRAGLAGVDPARCVYVCQRWGLKHTCLSQCPQTDRIRRTQTQ